LPLPLHFFALLAGLLFLRLLLLFFLAAAFFLLSTAIFLFLAAACLFFLSSPAFLLLPSPYFFLGDSGELSLEFFFLSLSSLPFFPVPLPVLGAPLLVYRALLPALPSVFAGHHPGAAARSPPVVGTSSSCCLRRSSSSYLRFVSSSVLSCSAA
jgi:hypothetical protein